MKHINIKSPAKWSLLGLLFALAGCSDSERMIDNDTVYDGMEVRVGVTVSSSQSRATNLTANDLDKFGLVINKNTASTTWTMPRIVTRVKNGATWGAWVFNSKLNWESLKNTVEVVCHTPYLESTLVTPAGNKTRELVFNANTTAGKEPVDWLYYYSGKVGLSSLIGTSGFIPVQFAHIMSRLRIEIIMREEFDASTQVSSVTILGTKPGLNWSTASPLVMNATGTASPVYTTATGELQGIWSTFIVPQAMTASTLKVQVVLNTGATYTYTHPLSHIFNTENAYKLSLRLGRKGLELSPDGMTVTDWENGDDIPGGKAEEASRSNKEQ